MSILACAMAGCGIDAASSASSPGPNGAAESLDLSAIACATDDPEGTGELTGAWQGDDRAVYYIRQVGDCVWWFGTGVPDLRSGALGQLGVANVAAGRVNGTQVVVEWADLPAGEVLGGGGLTLVYDAVTDELTITEQRGDWLRYGASKLTRIEQEAGDSAGGSPSASP
jgi:hypothetical protein